MTADSPKPRRAERLLRCALLLAALAAGSAGAHEGHEHALPENGAAAPSAPAARLSYQSARLEAVAALEAQGLVVWIDDYASNRPLSGLAVTARIGTANMQAQETEPGTYRVPADLLGNARGELALAVSVRGEGWDEHFAGALPRPPPVAMAARVPWRSALPAALGLAVLLAAVLVAQRLRSRRAR